MQPTLHKFVSCPILTPARDTLTKYLYPAGSKARDDDISLEFKKTIKEEFENSCAFCRKAAHTEVHHIVPWREALLVFDGFHAQRQNLIPLGAECGCHYRADAEVLPRDVLHARRANPKAAVPDALSNLSPLYGATELEIDVGRGNYRGRRGILWDAGQLVRPWMSMESKEKSLVRKATLARRCGSGGIHQALGLLKAAEDIAQDNQTRALISYERGKIDALKSNFANAAIHFRQCRDYASSDELLAMMAIHSERWVWFRKEVGGAQAPAVSLESDCGITHFAKYLYVPSPLSGKKWYVYNLLDRGEHFAQTGECERSISDLAEAGKWIDQWSMKELRPKLYVNLAYAFLQRGDLWRCVLAASASLGVFREIERQENIGLAFLISLEGLEKLGLHQSEQFAAVREQALHVDSQMDNRWALGQIKQLH